MLPLGRRVQDKLEALIDKYMYELGENSTLLLNNKADGLRGLQISSVVYLIRANMVKKRSFRERGFRGTWSSSTLDQY